MITTTAFEQLQCMITSKTVLTYHRMGAKRVEFGIFDTEYQVFVEVDGEPYNISSLIADAYSSKESYADFAGTMQIAKEARDIKVRHGVHGGFVSHTTSFGMTRILSCTLFPGQNVSLMFRNTQ